MEQMEKYYRVYAAFKESLDKIDSHRYMTAAQTLADSGEDSHIGKVYYRVVDLDWVEAIESTLVYIDKAIREQRRFIEVTEEVVPIEKARNITTESVRHLAQHTNLIARVEGSDVTPERILNIQREESFAIYENRFLYTLLQKLAYFVGLRYKALSDAPNDSFSKVKLHREFQVFDEKVEYDLAFSIESHTNTKVDLNADVSTLSGYERVLRIRTVLGDFLSTPLMRELTGCEPVRPPILHTNLMTKNPNFKKSLDLWNYIETYTKPGYQAAGNEFDGVLGENYKKALYDTVVLQQFAIELCSNPDLEEQLAEEYEEQRRLEEEERKAAEEEKFRLYEQKAELAVLEERDNLRKQMEELEKQIHSHKKEIADLTVDSENKERKIQRLTADVKHLEKEVSDRETRILNMQLELDRKANELEAAKAEAEKFKAKFAESEAKVAALEAQIPALEEKIVALQAELAAATASIAALTAELTAANEQLEQKAAEIAALQENITALQADVQAKAAEIACLNASLEERAAQIETLNATIEQQQADIGEKAARISEQAQSITALEADVADKASTITTLQTEISEKNSLIESKDAVLSANALELEQKAQAITALQADVAAKAADITARDTTIAAQADTIAAREQSIESLKSEIEAGNAAHLAELEKNAAAHTAALEKEQAKSLAALQQQRIEGDKALEAAVKAARKEELAVYKKKIAGINASAKSAIAAASAAAESTAKAKVLSVKNAKEFENGLSLEKFRALVRRACTIQKAAPSGKVSVLVDDYSADTKAFAEKYDLAVLPLSTAADKFEKSAAPMEALEAIAPMLERGDDVFFFASSEKKTGAIATVQLAANEAEVSVEAVDTEALTGSALAWAVCVKQLAALGERKEAIAAKQLSAITYLDKSLLGMPVKGKFKKITKTDELNLPLALDYIFTDCDKRFAFVLCSGMSEEEMSDFVAVLKNENGFEQVAAEVTADVRVKALGAKTATVYYFA